VSRITGKLSRRTESLSNRGFRGGKIAPHRAMIGLEVSWTLVIDLLVLPAIFAAVMLLFLDPLMDRWRAFFEWVQPSLGLNGGVAARVIDLEIAATAVPFFTASAGWPTPGQLQGGWLVMLLLALAGAVLRGRLTPFAYLARALAVLQLTAQLWFTFATPPFSYNLPDYINGLLVCGVVILLLAPFLVAFTFYIFDFQLWQKAAMALMLLGHLAVLLPLQATVHAWLLHRLSLLALPILFLVFGVLLDVFVYVALYGWGMSWRSDGPLDSADRRPPASAARTLNRARPTPASVRAITPSFGSPAVPSGPSNDRDGGNA
jgi:hypothetical protein